MPLREARRDETPLIVAMLVDDPLGKTREDMAGQAARYFAAFDAIAASSDNLLLVWEEAGAVLGCLQMTYIPGLSRTGEWRALIEGVRVASGARGKGVGEAMIGAAIAMARARGCGLMQLATDKRRVDAQRFYRRLGFAQSHEGMKLVL